MWNLMQWGGVRIVLESFLVICVNLFLIISGYYGLKFKLKSIASIGVLMIVVLLMQLISEVLIVPHFLHRDAASLTMGRVIEPFLFISSSDYFVVDYIFLMVLSPILNSFINTYGRKILPYVMVLVCIETWFGCIRPNQYFFINGGYGIVHFVIMYMIARCLFLYKEELGRVKPMMWTAVCMICMTALTTMYVAGIEWTFDYSNPVVIIESVAFFMLFVNKSFYSKRINWIASGTFAVYILHRYNPFHYVIKETDNYLFTQMSFFKYVLYSIPLLVAFYFFAICFDKMVNIIRKPIMRQCEKIQETKLNKIFAS